MPKRSATERIDYYRNKIKKLEEKSKPRYRRIISTSSDSSNGGNKSDTEGSMSTEMTAQPGTNTDPILDENPNFSDIQPSAVEAVTATQEPIPEPELNADILLALGSKTSDEPEYGENIHDSLAQLWSPLLKKGMRKKTRTKS
ncbi:hypothetical protein MSG28_010632 [Choristoneura fumiferana]|uniref:Uncharacterized protein n=1 Tax=Choristoneura fumiferana TaxID=7141 RepID=A0ACC0KNU7_CHOFU|nr:hypothetical protein MSG28_010632 [Choristoneura fumiferana]